jgi:signal transduction histidine kinase
MVLLLAALVLPTVILTAFALHERELLLREGEHMARRTANALTEHALKVLETHTLVLGQVDEQIRDRTWTEIESDARLQRSLSSVVEHFPHVQSIWLFDAQGRARQRTGVGAAEAAVTERDYFAAHRSGIEGRVFISRPFEDPASPGRQFTVSIRRTTADGRFDGLIAVAVGIDYFTSFWRQFTPAVDHVIPLMRSDGTMLVRHPAGRHPDRLPATAPYMQQIARAPAGGFYIARSQVDGIERMNAYSRIGDYPLYVSFSLQTDALLAPWRSRAMLYGLLSLMTTLALAGMVLMAMRQAQAQRRAAAAWREAAERNAAEIRRRERAEAELVQAQKMEAVGQLTGGVAHDFNNLLHAMSLNVHLAQREVGRGPAAKYLENARRGVERAAQLTRQLTAFSRRQRLEPTSFAPAALIVRMGDLLHRTLGGTIQLEVDAAQDVWPVYADPGQTELALLNLAVNARDAMPGGGRLAIRARNLTLPSGSEELASGEYVELAVIDNGTGMSPEVAQRAFEPFFTTKGVGKGSGLGLSMVHGFATQSGGTVSIDSSPGRGTVVRLVLPRAASAPEPVEECAATQGPVSALGGRVLLVDDDSLVRASMLLALRSAGYEVEEAGSGADALNALRRAPADVLVTDYAMPGMTGTELAALARAMQPGLPVVLVTGYAEPGLGLAPVHDVDVVLHKPFSTDTLIGHIERLAWQDARDGASA